MIKFSERAFLTLVLTAFAGLMLYLTLNLGRLARLVPLKVVILTLVFLIFQLLIDMVPGLAKKYSRFEKTDLFKVGSSREKTLTQDDAEEISGNLSRSRRELGMVLWVLMMLVFTYILGLLIAIPLYTFLYLKVRSGEGWFISLTMTAGVWGVLYGGFILILSVSLFEGHLWRWIGI